MQQRVTNNDAFVFFDERGILNLMPIDMNYDNESENRDDRKAQLALFRIPLRFVIKLKYFNLLNMFRVPETLINLTYFSLINKSKILMYKFKHLLN